jgi:hypothetical protein
MMASRLNHLRHIIPALTDHWELAGCFTVFPLVAFWPSARKSLTPGSAQEDNANIRHASRVKSEKAIP